jgi:predicted Zn-dependent protease
MKKVINTGLAAVLTAGLMLAPPAWSGAGRQRISTLAQQRIGADDISVEVRFGRDLAARILGNYRLVDDPQLQRYVNLVGRGIAALAGRPEIEFYFGVLDSRAANAFATPGGYIFITTGALVQMEDEAQLACVLGHEIIHVVRRHVAQELNLRSGDSAMAGLAGLIGGATGSFRGALEHSLNKASEILFERGYLMKDELEADAHGVMLAALAGYDPLALADYLGRVKRFEAGQEVHNVDHPAYGVRATEIRKTIETNGLSAPHHRKAHGQERFHAMVHH